MAFLDTGVTKSGSSEPRSRSPAVVSIATFMPETNAAMMINSGMKLRKLADRCWLVAMSSSSIRTGVRTSLDTPLAISRSALI